MSNIGSWSPIADQNNSPPPDGAPESMPRNTVNNTMRENMAANARQFRDQNGGLVASGPGSAYAVTSTGSLAGNPYTSYNEVSFICFEANVDCLSGPTLSIDGLAPLPLVFDGQSSLSSGDIIAGNIVVAQYNPGHSRFELLNARQRGFELGTRMLFQQTNVPSGWQKITTYNDMGLRVVSGSASAKTDGALWSTTMAFRDVPLLRHVHYFDDSFTTDSDSHNHTTPNAGSLTNRGTSTVVAASSSTATTSSDSHNHSGSVGGDTDDAGDDPAQMDFDMNRVDVVIGSAL